MRKKPFYFTLFCFLISGMIRGENIYLHIPDGSEVAPAWSINNIRAVHFTSESGYTLVGSDGSELFVSSMEKSPLWIFSPDSTETSIVDVDMQDEQSLMVLYRDNDNITLHLEQAIEGLFTIRIYDVQGRVCYQNTHSDANEIEISTQDFAQGVYQILLYASEGVSCRSNYIKY